MPTFSGAIKKTNTKDVVERTLEAGTYKFRLEASGGGKVRVKVEAEMLPMIGDTGNYRSRWITVEERSKITNDSALEGTFIVPQQHLSSQQTSDETKIHFILSRGLLTKGSEYRFSYDRAS